MLKNQITLSDCALFNEYLSSYYYQTSGLSFTSLYMWRDINNFRYEVINDYLCICGNSHLETAEAIEPFFFPPLTRTGSYDLETLSDTIDALKQRVEEKGFVFSIRLLPAHMVDLFESCKPGIFKFISDRPNFDYVYLSSDLTLLKGRSFHSKKNHLNYFKKNFSYEYIPLSAALAEDCMELNAKVLGTKAFDSHEEILIKMEEDAIHDALTNFEKAGYIGGAIRINGRIEAFTIGGHLNKKSIVVHVEKANTEFRGLYQAINNEFCRHEAQNVKYVNREEDMGLLGLRKSKCSYHPVKFIEKYIAIYKSDL